MRNGAWDVSAGLPLTGCERQQLTVVDLKSRHSRLPGGESGHHPLRTLTEKDRNNDYYMLCLQGRGIEWKRRVLPTLNYD